MEEIKANGGESILTNNLSGLEGEVNDTGVLKWSQLLLFLLIFLGFGALIGVLAVIYDAVTESHLIDLITTSYSGLILDAFIFFIVVYTYKSVRIFSFKAIDFSVLRYKKTYLYIISGFAIFLITQYILLQVLKIDNPLKQQSDLGINQLNSWGSIVLFVFSVAILTPIKEEFLYRGIIYRFFEKKYPKYGFWLGLVTSSLIFGLLHFGVQFSATVMSFTLIILYRLTKSLVPLMILHMLWNLYAVVVIFLSY